MGTSTNFAGGTAYTATAGHLNTRASVQRAVDWVMMAGLVPTRASLQNKLIDFGDGLQFTCKSAIRMGNA